MSKTHQNSWPSGLLGSLQRSPGPIAGGALWAGGEGAYHLSWLDYSSLPNGRASGFMILGNFGIIVVHDLVHCAMDSGDERQLFSLPTGAKMAAVGRPGFLYALRCVVRNIAAECVDNSAQVANSRPIYRQRRCRRCYYFSIDRCIVPLQPSVLSF